MNIASAPINYADFELTKDGNAHISQR